MTTTIRTATTLAAGTITLLGLAGCSAAATTGVTNASSAAAPVPPVTPASGTASAATTATGTAPTAAGSQFTDGSYTATGTYESPGGQAAVGVALSLKDDIVTKVTVTPKANDATSKFYEKKFASGVGRVVVGKKLAQLKVTTVSGSSLTSQGFDKAITAIESQAKA